MSISKLLSSILEAWFLLPSCFRAAALLVELDLVLEPVVQFEVVVLQGRRGSRGEPAVRACAIEEQPGTHGSQQNA